MQANRSKRDAVIGEKAKLEAAIEKLEQDNKQRAEAIRQLEAEAAKERAAALAAEQAQKRDLILQLRCCLMANRDG